MSVFTTSHPRTPKCSRLGGSGRDGARLPRCGDIDELADTQNPWNPEYAETTLSCLHVILEEEWEHHRYAVRDLDAIGPGRPTSVSAWEDS